MHARELFDRLRAAVRVTGWPDSAEVLAELQRLEREEQAREQVPIVFRESRQPGYWQVGDAEVRDVHDEMLLGVRAAHCAMTGRRIACRDLAPNGNNPEKVVGRAVREQAAAWANRNGCPRLAREMLRIQVQGELLVYKRGPYPAPLTLW